MKTLLMAGLPIVVLMPVMVMAQSDFDGTWKIDVSKTTVSTKTDTFVLKNGIYQCKTCLPAINVKADGEDHSVNKNPYYDTISVKVLSDQGIERTEKQKGETLATSRMTVSPDGATATVEYSGNTNSDPVTYKEVMTRLGKGAPAGGSHAISGSWRTSKMESISDKGLMLTLKVGDNFNMTTPAGRSCSAKLDGTDAPCKADSGINGVSVVRLGKGAVEETDKRDGKAVRVTRFMVSPDDAKTMHIIVVDNLRGTTMVLVADKL